MLEWKEKYADKYAVLLEGARRVGKSTIAEQFAINEYKSYILIDFSKTSDEEIACFDDINDLDMFFLRLQAVRRVDLYEQESVIIFDEVQLFPKARQAIKHLVKDGRYHYIETGSLISIKKNVKNILIPSEEMKIQVYPMDYEEFCGATGNSHTLLEKIYEKNKEVGQQINRKLMRAIRIYMAVGGMPQAVESYVNGNNFSMIDSKTVLPSYNSTDPRVSLSLSKDLDSYKLYIADTGLFITLMFIDRPVAENELYAKLLSDKLPANLGYLYENLIAQMITASGRELYYHTWEKKESTHYYEVDFLVSQGAKVSAIEVKSSGTGKHESLTEFSKRYSKHIKDSFILSQKDIGKEGIIKYIPIYLASFLCK